MQNSRKLHSVQGWSMQEVVWACSGFCQSILQAIFSDRTFSVWWRQNLPGAPSFQRFSSFRLQWSESDELNPLMKSFFLVFYGV